MASPEVVVLDVGHGNCAVVIDDRGVVILDAAAGTTLIEFLEERGLREIDAVLISHADADHIAGVLPLLLHSMIVVQAIYLNPDALKRTHIWEDFRRALADARKRHGTEIHTQLTTTSSAQFARDDLRIEILAPTPEVAASGSGGYDLEGRPLAPNTMSVAARIVVSEVPLILFLGDLDDVGLDNLLAESPAPHARILVFPHHGGLPGRADGYEFARRVSQVVEPDTVIFSIGRGIYGTPRPEIIRGVLSVRPKVHIACTQLSQRCAANLPPSPASHLAAAPARGRGSNSCCAGTIAIRAGRAPDYVPSPDEHREFVDDHAPTALCLGRES